MSKDKNSGSHIRITESSEETFALTETHVSGESTVLAGQEDARTGAAGHSVQADKAGDSAAPEMSAGETETGDKPGSAERAHTPAERQSDPSYIRPAPIRAVPIMQAGSRNAGDMLEDAEAGDKDDKDGKGASEKSFADMVYEQINSVLGGTNPNQFLCLTIPGQALSAEDFAYDYKNNAPKGPVVEANESRLVNKLFDPCRMTGADNGLTLPYQYRSALDMLTPKLNSRVAAAKNQLRELLMTEYPYDFGDDKTYTLQEVFFKLYDDWVAAEKDWADEQNKQKEKLRRDFKGDTAESNMKYNDAYLTWYEAVAASRLTEINEKFSKVISVFTPNDMKILEGILDSGSGAELQQARETLNNIGKLSPDGGYVYPVKLNPTGWFELLDTSFTPIDLLKDPEVLAMQLQSLSSGRNALNARINEIASVIPEDKVLKDAKEAVKAAKSKVDSKRNELIQTYGSGISKTFDAVLDIIPLFAEGVPGNILAKLTAGTELPKGKTPEELIKSLSGVTEEIAGKQQEYISACGRLAAASEEAIKAKNMAELGNILSPLKFQLADIDMQITSLKTQLQLSAMSRPAPEKDGTVKDKDTSKDAVSPRTVPEGYTSVVITADASCLDKESSQSSSAAASTSGASFLFCGYHSESSSSSSAFSGFTSQNNTHVQIGMNVAKVGIEREWFNPGIFALTKDMFNVTNLKISPNPQKPYTSVTEERLTEMAAGGYIFPCFPVAMVIARDITIKMISSSSVSSEFSRSVEEHASSGGGFLFFSGSKSSSSSSSSSGVHSSSTGNTVTLKFDTPQIIGYYLEATAADKSTYLDDVSGDDKAGYVTISRFVEDYKKMLEAMKEKMKKKEEENIA